MMRPGFPPRFQWVDPFTRLLAAFLAVGLALSVPATVTAEGLLCVHHLAHGGGEQSDGDGAHGAPDGGDPHGAHHGDGAPDSEPPSHPCFCPHPCGPGAAVGGIPASAGILAILSHPPVALTQARDILPLPLFDPRGVPTGPDPPTPSFFR